MVRLLELLVQFVPGSVAVPNASFDSEYFVLLPVCNYFTVITSDLIPFTRFCFYLCKLLQSSLFFSFTYCILILLYVYFLYELFILNLMT